MASCCFGRCCLAGSSARGVFCNSAIKGAERDQDMAIQARSARAASLGAVVGNLFW